MSEDLFRDIMLVVIILYLITLCLYLWLIWWILTMPLSELKGR